MAEESLEDFRRRLDAVVAFTFLVAVVSVAAKLWSKKIRVGWSNLWWDGYLAIFTLGLATIFLVINVVGLRPYVGKHTGTGPDEATMDDVVVFLKWAFAMIIMYLTCVTFTKFTTLALYWKLFDLSAHHLIPVVASFVFLWWLIVLPMFIFSCGTVEAQFEAEHDPSVADKCLSSTGLFLGIAIPNTIFDILIVSMPIPIVWKLRMPPGQRIILAGMFALGTFIYIVSIIRVVIVMRLKGGDPLYNQRDYIIWTVVEVNVGLACSCLPGTRPLLMKLGLSRLFSSLPRGARDAPTGAVAVTPTTATFGAGGNRRESRVKSSASEIINALIRASPRDGAINEDDAFQMVDHSSPKHGAKTEANHLAVDVEAQLRSFDDTDGESGRGMDPKSHG